MPKQNPYLIKENYKKVEIIQEIEKYEIKKSPLSSAARDKVVNKSGGNYLSGNEEFYGPGNSDSRPIGGFPSNSPMGRMERQRREDARNRRIDEAAGFVIKTAAKATAAAALTTATGGLAPIVGGGVWIGGKWLESKNDEFLQFLGRSLGDIGCDVFSSGLFSSSSVGEFAGKNNIDLKRLENLFEMKGRVETGWVIAEHNKHRNEGVSYKGNCEICRL